MVIDRHEGVLVTANSAPLERSDEIGVEETSDVRRGVDVVGRVRMPRGIGLDAMRARTAAVMAYAEG